MRPIDKWPEAIGAYRKAADKGSTTAMVELGVLLATGAGVRQGRSPGAPAVRARRRRPAIRAAPSISRRSPRRQRGAVGSGHRPARVLAKAAETNSAEAQYQLGMMIAEGIGGPKDDVAARALFEKAAAQGHPEALERMGAFAQGGRGGPQDANAAKAYYEQAGGARQ